MENRQRVWDAGGPWQSRVPDVTLFFHAGPPEPQLCARIHDGFGRCAQTLRSLLADSQWMQKESCYPGGRCRSCLMLARVGRSQRGQRWGWREGRGHPSLASTSLLSEEIFPKEQSLNAKPGAAVETAFQKYPDQWNEPQTHMRQTVHER